MDCQLDIFFLEAILNGLLLAGLLALLALGLNLIFGVIDVVWICYAELVMVGMYGIHYAYKGGTPFLAAALFGIVLIALAGMALHYLVIRPVLDSAPINQLLVTGGMLFVLQAAATMAFGIDFKNIGLRLGSLNAFDMSFSYSRIVTFGVALATMLLLWVFLQRTYIGIAGHAIAFLFFMVVIFIRPQGLFGGKS